MSKIKKGDTVKVHYTGTFENGEIFDSSKVEGREALEFEVGGNTLIPAFEQGVIDLSVGETTEINISANDAYGPIIDQLVFNVELEKLPVGIVENTYLEVNTPMGPQSVKILSINEEEKTATIDHNHPLAGKDLKFEIEILEIVSAPEIVNN